jgi:hypothetical protein
MQATQKQKTLANQQQQHRQRFHLLSLPSCRNHITAAVVPRFNLLKNHFLSSSSRHSLPQNLPAVVLSLGSTKRFKVIEYTVAVMVLL